MIVTRDGRAQALRSARIPTAIKHPSAGVLPPVDGLEARACGCIIGAGRGLVLTGRVVAGHLLAAPLALPQSAIAARTLVDLVLRLLAIIAAPPDVVREDGNVAPRRRVPVGVVVALLGTLEAAPRAGGVLARKARAVAVTEEVLVGGVQALVTLSLKAILVPSKRLVHAELRVGRTRGGGGHRGGRPAVAQVRIAQLEVLLVAHVLQDQLALDIGLRRTTAVLVGPLDVEVRALVEIHDALAGSRGRRVVGAIRIGAHRFAIVTHLIASFRIVLAVEQPVLVLSLVAHLVQLVVRSARMVHIQVRHRDIEVGEEQGGTMPRTHDLRLAPSCKAASSQGDSQALAPGLCESVGSL